MAETKNYKFLTYENTDAPDLTNQYNKSMTLIDTELKTVADSASAGIDTKSVRALDAATLAKLGITKDGIVVVLPETE